jgi:undecaprenyl-diphosphatase
MAWEFDVLYWFQSIHGPVQDAFFSFITHFGDAGAFWIIASLLVLIFVKDKRVGATAVLALLMEFILCNLILKPLVARDRPFWIDTTVPMLVKPPKDFSFPSGHSGASFAVAVAFVQYNKKWGIAAIVLAACIAISRMYLFIHFPTDVLAGSIIGACFGVLAGVLVRRFARKREMA